MQSCRRVGWEINKYIYERTREKIPHVALFKGIGDGGESEKSRDRDKKRDEKKEKIIGLPADDGETDLWEQVPFSLGDYDSKRATRIGESLETLRERRLQWVGTWEGGMAEFLSYDGRNNRVQALLKFCLEKN